MVSIQDFDSCCIGSNPIRFTNGGFSLCGKISHCEWEEQGSNPEITPKFNEQLTVISDQYVKMIIVTDNWSLKKEQ